MRIFTIFAVATLALAQSGPIVRTDFHLTARPWAPLLIPKERYLDAIERICRFSMPHQNSEGAIIDPYLHREHQYATPYFAYAAVTLIDAGRAPDLLPAAVKAMDHATHSFAGGNAAIPDQHGNFFIAALTGALPLFRGHVPKETLALWTERMRKPRRDVQAPNAINNWETYVMKGEWMRALAGLADRRETVAAIEDAWTARQHGRIAAPPWRLYHDRTSDPDTLSVEAVGRGNLLALAHLGYDGPSASQIREAAEAATALTLLLQDPSGQAPTNGRTDDHVWVDVGYQLAFEVMAERSGNNQVRAGEYRHAAMLAFQNIERWRRQDGSYSVTKNHFDPALRVGYQPASQMSNYNGSLMFHLAEAYHARSRSVEEQPVPAEVGGYAVELDPQFASAFANAGGMQMQVNLRGQVPVTHENRWSPLGVVRFARSGWDTRLGPSDGALTIREGGITFAPTFFENGRWLRLADLSDRYEGEWSVSFVHPLLVRCAVDYRPKPGQAAPTFRNDFTLTPDGILSEMRKTSGAPVEWAVTWPILENDGRPLEVAVTGESASTGYAGSSDRQNFIALSKASITSDAVLRSTYGDLRALRVRTDDPVNRTFIYPSSASDPSAAVVRERLATTPGGFHSTLAEVSERTYVGRTAAGGVGKSIDLNHDGRADVTFDRECSFVLQLDHGRILAMEADRPVKAKLEHRPQPYRLQAHVPVKVAR